MKNYQIRINNRNGGNKNMGKLGGREVKNPMNIAAPKIKNPIGGANAKSPVTVPSKLRIK